MSYLHQLWEGIYYRSDWWLLFTGWPGDLFLTHWISTGNPTHLTVTDLELSTELHSLWSFLKKQLLSMLIKLKLQKDNCTFMSMWELLQSFRLSHTIFFNDCFRGQGGTLTPQNLTILLIKEKMFQIRQINKGGKMMSVLLQNKLWNFQTYINHRRIVYMYRKHLSSMCSGR